MSFLVIKSEPDKVYIWDGFSKDKFNNKLNIFELEIKDHNFLVGDEVSVYLKKMPPKE